MMPVAPKAPVRDRVEPTTIGSPDGAVTVDGDASADPSGLVAGDPAGVDGADDAAGEHAASSAVSTNAASRFVGTSFT
jgi:hypothetical protein